MGEAESSAATRVERHLTTCVSCRREFQEYRAIDGRDTLREGRPERSLAQSRSGWRRGWRISGTAAGLSHLPIAPRAHPDRPSELGISLVEYLERGKSLRASRLSHEPGVEMVEGGAEIEAIYRELLEYLEAVVAGSTGPSTCAWRGVTSSGRSSRPRRRSHTGP